MKWASVAFVLSVFRNCDFCAAVSGIRPPGIRRLVVWFVCWGCFFFFSSTTDSSWRAAPLHAVQTSGSDHSASFIHSPSSAVVHSRALVFRLQKLLQRICVGFARSIHRTAAPDTEEPRTGETCLFLSPLCISVNFYELSVYSGLNLLRS